MSKEQTKPEGTTTVMRIVVAVIFTIVLALSAMSYLAGSDSTGSSTDSYQNNTTTSESPF
ncbi:MULTISPECIES: hypothetical protein [Vibrio harveyi group]|uniref:Uncharacterized protein n=1 Tax=Vibrio owensii CAIM 1854 = LMG 25443 TaxID=1229493 RepID=A0A0C1WAW3_9VIBR|nr:MULTISPECIES: hypothetical protein [Vibrio harveyi group]KIF53432.1 hypothetical protein H735_11005 [Vibrio owensii CAIM 1854 = LMG 25443]MCZ2799159.1 hypothetical protein [Vibrio alginolyticus]